MARRSKETSRVLGPYRRGDSWRFVVVHAEGGRTDYSCASEKEAHALIARIEARFGLHSSVLVTGALDDYEIHLLEKGNKATSRASTMYRLRGFLGPVEQRLLRQLAPEEFGVLYARIVARQAVDTHRNTLAEVKTFFQWCLTKEWVRRNPVAEIQGRGKRRRGKEQLRIDEARRWLARATILAEQGKAGPVAAMLTLLVGLRCSEVVSRVVRDLDDDGQLLWIPESKTEAGRRTLRVPKMLQPFLLKLAEGKTSTAPLFGYHDRNWPRRWVQRICDEVEVTKVTAHGMRGLHSTLALEAGETAPVVAAALGHESATTTLGHYAAPGAGSAAKQDRALHALEGHAGCQRNCQRNENGPGQEPRP